jgi:Tfp pilus assembly protein PilF
LSGGDVSEAKDYFSKTIETNPKDAQAARILATLCLKEDNPKGALDLINKALEGTDPTGDIYLCFAQIYQKMGDKDKVIENLENALNNFKTLTTPIDLVKRKLKELR